VPQFTLVSPIENFQYSGSSSSPLVSVGIPTFNRPEGLRRTLQQITQQTYGNLEIIVSDNCSPAPDTENIVRQFMEQDARIKYYRQSENIGATNNFKFLLMLAKGDFFMWAADDDEWSQHFVSICANHMQSDVNSVMPHFTYSYRAQGRLHDCGILPDLSPENSRATNAANYLKNLRSNLFYGLHRRESLLQFLIEEGFDWYDCFFILRQIIQGNYRLVPDRLYCMGVDTPDYVVKPAQPKQGRLIEYCHFYHSCKNLFLGSSDLDATERSALISLLDNRIVQLIRKFEASHQPERVALDDAAILALLSTNQI
jgi:glycosyltransferase involved in cell wall biosynthesis